MLLCFTVSLVNFTSNLLMYKVIIATQFMQMINWLLIISLSWYLFSLMSVWLCWSKVYCASCWRCQCSGKLWAPDRTLTCNLLIASHHWLWIEPDGPSSSKMYPITLPTLIVNCWHMFGLHADTCIVDYCTIIETKHVNYVTKIW